MNLKLSNLISYFHNSPGEIDEEFEKNHILKNIPKGQFIAMEGEECNYLPIVKSGVVRVYKLSENGNEMTLYRIKPGESCILTISCLLTNQKFPAIAFTESDSEIVLIDSHTIKNWVDKYDIWRQFIFNYMANIIFKVIKLLEDTTFSRTEIRILDFLYLKNTELGSQLKFTHQQIAREIGTSREVVSRILKDLESQKTIKLSRGTITILKKDGLKKKNSII